MVSFLFFFFNDTATTEIYTLSLHDALPIFLVEVAGLERDEVDLLPRRVEQPLGGFHGEAGALVHDDLPRCVADVVAEHLVHEDVDARRLAALVDGLHFTLTLSGWPVAPPRTAWISARIASAISGAPRAPRPRPIGTRIRFRAASLTPSSARNLRSAAPRRGEPSIPM